MTIRAYITEKLKAFGISEAQLIDISMSSGLDLESDVTAADQSAVGIAMTKTLEECIFAPRLTNVSENGFSMSWNYESIGKYYLWLCRRWGLTPNDEVLAMLGISSIIDRTDCW